jgi:hypothetical protein
MEGGRRRAGDTSGGGRVRLTREKRLRPRSPVSHRLTIDPRHIRAGTTRCIDEPTQRAGLHETSCMRCAEDVAGSEGGRPSGDELSWEGAEDE